MLQAMMNQNVLLYGMLVFSVLGGISQIILNSIYRRAMKDIGNIGMPKSKLVRQIKEKYQNLRRVNQNAVTNMNVFLEQAMMEGKVLGINLHTWRRLGGAAFVLCLIMAAAGYYIGGTLQMAQQNYLWATLASAFFVAAMYGLTDTSYKRKYLMVGLESAFVNILMRPEAGKIKAVDREAVKSIEREMDEFDEKRTSFEQVVQSKRQQKRASRAKNAQTKAQRDKQELKENLAKLKEGMRETAADVERSKERNTEILKQMDSEEQERVIREILKEFLS